MSSDFLFEQCKVIEDTFYGGAEDPTLRTFVEEVTTADTFEAGDDELATVDEIEMVDEDSLSDVESVDFDPEVFMEAGIVQDEIYLEDVADQVEKEIQLQGGAVAALGAPAFTEDLAYEVPSVKDGYEVPSVKDGYEVPSVKDGYEVPSVKDAYFDNLQTELGQLEDDMDQLEGAKFEDRAYELETLHEQDGKAAVERNIDRQLDLMEDPVWLQGGVEYMREYRAKLDRFNREYSANVIESRPLNESGRLIPPQPGHVHCLAWMDRLLTYLSSANFDTMPLEQLTQLYTECAATIQVNTTLSMLPVRPEWLRFQAYVARRRE